MFFNKNKVFFGFAICLVPASLFAVSAIKTDRAVKKSKTSVEQPKAPVQYKNFAAPVEIRSLSNDAMKQLNFVLEIIPSITGSIDAAKTGASTVRQDVEARLLIENRDPQEDAAFIQNKFDILVAAADDFLDYIKSHPKTQPGLVMASLDGQSYRQGLTMADSFLCKYFESSEPLASVKVQGITTLEALLTFSKDIEALCGSIMNSLTQKAKNAFLGS